jgi:tetratricopeptide (TPR) repeat protein
MNWGLIVLFAATLVAQEPALRVERRGPIALVTASATLSVREAIMRLAEASGCTVRIAPEALAAADSERVELDCSGLLLADAVQHLGAVAGLVAELDGKTITLATCTNSPAAAERVRVAAVDWYGRATLASPRDEGAGDSAFRAAALELDGGRAELALAGFRVYAEGHPQSELAARAWYQAGVAAFILGRHAEARTALEHVDELASGRAIAPDAALLTARTYAAEGATADATTRLLRASAANNLRTAVEAELLLAEGQLRAGNAAVALEGLEKAAKRTGRALPDIAGRIPLWTGRVLLASKNARAAITQFQTAMLTAPSADDRAQAALGLVRATRAAGDSVQALMAARTLLAMDPQGAVLRAALHETADLQAAVGLTDAAVASLERLINETPEGDPMAVKALNALAKLLCLERRYDEARSLFAALALREDMAALADLEVARCDVALGEPTRALAVLDRITDAALAGEARMLRAKALGALGRHREASMVLSSGEKLP